MTRINHQQRNREARVYNYPSVERNRRPDAADAYLQGHHDGHRDGYARGQRDGFAEGHIRGLEEGIEVGVAAGFDGGLTVVDELPASVRFEGGEKLRQAAYRRAVEKRYIAAEDVDDRLLH